MGGGNKPLECLVRLKQGKTCRDEETFKKAIQKIINRKPENVVLSGKWFEAKFSLHPSAVRQFERADFQVKPIN